MAAEQYLYTLRAARAAMLTDGPSAAEAAAVAAHANYLQELAHAGVVLLAGRTQTTGPETFGIVVFTAESDAQAQAVMQDDPAISHGVMVGQLYPYRVAVVSDAILAASG